MEDKDFDYIVLKSSRSSMNFETLSGTEHLLQANNDQFTNDLFYSDRLNLFELYNSVKAVSEAAPQLQLESTVANLEQKYATALEQNETYLTLNQDGYEPKFLLSELIEEDLKPLPEPSSEEVK